MPSRSPSLCDTAACVLRTPSCCPPRPAVQGKGGLRIHKPYILELGLAVYYGGMLAAAGVYRSWIMVSRDSTSNHVRASGLHRELRGWG
jgi:hypothetical protein